MKKSLDAKIQTAEDKLITHLGQVYGIDLMQKPEREARAFMNLTSNIRLWFSDLEERKTAEKPFENLVNGYFIELENKFESLLKEELITAASAKNARELNLYLNELTKAIALEKVKNKALALLIDTSTNS